MGVSPAEERLTIPQARTVALCFALNVLNGAAIQSVSYAAPLFAAEWGLSDRTLGLVFSTGLAGMTTGSLALGPLSDVVGRKTVVIFSAALIATGMISSSLATGAVALMTLRFWVGLGVGSMLASLTSLASEHAPPARRAFAVMTASAGYPLGAMATGFAGGAVMPIHGWPALFLGAGALSAASLPLVWRLLTESPEFVRARRPAAHAAARTRGSRERLARAVLRGDTLLLWCAFVSSYVTLYFLVSWIPRIAVDAGFAIEHAIHAGAIYHLGSFLGRLLVGGLSRRVDVSALIAGFFTLAALLLPLFGAAHDSLVVFLAGTFALGTLAQGGFGGLSALAARMYPAVIRTTGVGWASGAGRIGGVIGPYLGGLVLAWGVGLFASCLIFALPLLAAALAAVALGAQQRRAPASARGERVV